jgi:proteasome lid subunit RPN8/RPN11
MDTTELRMGADHLEQLQAVVARWQPREACAALIGALTGQTALVESVAELKNHSRTADCFSVPRQDFSRLFSNVPPGHQYLAFFHSHRSGVTLSPADVQCLRELGGISVVGSLPNQAGGKSDQRMQIAAYIEADDGTINTIAITRKE